MIKSQFEFEVLVNGSSAKEYSHQGNYYIEAKEGSKFSLRLRNNSNQRALFVPTVDGLSVMSGDEASFKSRGYIVKAYDAITIDGWRTDKNTVAQFFFSNPKASYAQKINKGGNLGVIGCAVFQEITQIHTYDIMTDLVTTYPKIQPWYFNVGTGGTTQTSNYPLTNSQQCNTFYSAASGNTTLSCSNVTPGMSAGVATGFGEDKHSPTITVEFDKQPTPAAVFSFYYNTRKNLEAMGVEFKKPVYVTPSAFPNEEGYCKRPN